MDADHPSNGVPIPRLSTGEDLPSLLLTEALRQEIVARHPEGHAGHVYGPMKVGRPPPTGWTAILCSDIAPDDHQALG